MNERLHMRLFFCNLVDLAEALELCLLRTTATAFEMYFYANDLLDIFYSFDTRSYTPKFSSCCVFLQTSFKRTLILGEVPKVSA